MLFQRRERRLGFFDLVCTEPQITRLKPVPSIQSKTLIKTSHGSHFLYLPINYPCEPTLSRPAVWGTKKVDSFLEDLDGYLR